MLAKNPLPGLRALALANVLTVLKLSTLYSMCAQCVYCSAKKLIPTVIHPEIVTCLGGKIQICCMLRITEQHRANFEFSRPDMLQFLDE